MSFSNAYIKIKPLLLVKNVLQLIWGLVDVITYESFSSTKKLMKV